MSYKSITLIIFISSYIGIMVFTRKKTYFAGTGAILFLLIMAVLNTDSPGDIFSFIIKSINWNVIGIFLGTLLIAEAFIDSGVPALIAYFLVSRTKTTGMAILVICLMTSFLSMFIENVATVLIVAPIALAIAENQDISPVPFLIGLAVCSNLQGTATLIGDPPSMILAGYMRMNFNQFFILNGKLGIFFAVQVGALISILILYFFYRNYRKPFAPVERPEVGSFLPSVIIGVMIVLLAFSSLVDPDFSYFGGIICMLLGIFCELWVALRGHYSFKELFRKLDFETLIFLTSIFILVGSLKETGIINDAAGIILKFVGGNKFLVYTAIVWFSVFVSAFIDNVPYITAMIPVTSIIAQRLGLSPYLFVFGLLIGSCLGGNITHVGASANVVAVSILKRRGYHIGLKEFGKIGLPFTLGATIGAYFLIWFVWG
ncbi:MAG: SLC13 family permease [Spirochaetota bacterium]